MFFRLIFSDNNSRNLFCFLCLNLSFAFVELFYGMWTNSLGLISDSFHMFFDCSALIAGLVASVITKWPANERFSFGYGRAEILAGFVNGLFLVFIAFYIFTEAVERLFEPPEVKHERLFVISVLGLLVNLVGIFVFQHGGSHHGHSHSSSDHSGHSHTGNPLLNGIPHNDSYSFVTETAHGHSHANGYDHSHSHSHSHGGHKGSGGRSQIMQGVFLHIMADTLGSVGVIISALLMNYFGWMIADPICSMFIATLVGLSVYPLLRDSIGIIMQRTPKAIEDQLALSLQRVSALDGVLSIQEPHFWALCTDKYIGSLRVEVRRNVDYNYIQSMIRGIFAGIEVKQVYIEIHFSPS